MQEQNYGDWKLRLKFYEVRVYIRISLVFDSFKGVSVLLISSVMS